MRRALIGPRAYLGARARSAPAPVPRPYRPFPSRRRRHQLPAEARRHPPASRAPSATASPTRCCSTSASRRTSGSMTSSLPPPSAQSAACFRSSLRRRAPSGDEPTTSSRHCPSSRFRASLHRAWRRRASRHRAWHHPSWHRYASRRNACRRCSRASRRRATTWLVLPCVSILVRVVTGASAISAHKLRRSPASSARRRRLPRVDDRRVGERGGVGKIRRDLSAPERSVIGEEEQVEFPFGIVATGADACHLMAPDDAPPLAVRHLDPPRIGGRPAHDPPRRSARPDAGVRCTKDRKGIARCVVNVTVIYSSRSPFSRRP
jgi:hypothetical protein